MGVPGADDIMLGYQSTSFHDVLAIVSSPAGTRVRDVAAAPGPAGCRGACSDARRAGAAARATPRVQRIMSELPTVTDGGVEDAADDLWATLRRSTAARIGLARTGASLATG